LADFNEYGRTELNDANEEVRYTYYGWIVVGMAIMANFIAFGLVNSFTIFFKPVSNEFGWSRGITAGAFSAYAITHDFFAPLTGWITDRFGPKLIVAMGGMCLSGAMFLMGYIGSIWELYVYYPIIFGMGIACIYAPMMATVSRWFYVKRGLAIGLASTGLGLGSLVLSPLAAWLVSDYGWRLAYIVMGSITLGIFIPITALVRRSPSDYANETPQNKRQNDMTFAQAIRTRLFWVFGFHWFFTGLVLYAILVHIVPLITDRGINLTTAGLVTGLVGGGSIFGRVMGGSLSDRVQRKVVLLCAQGLLLAMLIWLLFSVQLWMFVVFSIIFGIGLGGWGGVVAALPADYFGLRSTATIFGVLMIFAGSGVALGSYMGGIIFDITNSYVYMIVLCILSMVVAILLGCFLRNPRNVTQN